MACRAELLVSIGGDRLAEGRVHSAILKAGAAVEGLERRMAPNGNRDHRFTISFERESALDELVHSLGKVEGAAVKSVTLFTPSSSHGV